MNTFGWVYISSGIDFSQPKSGSMEIGFLLRIPLPVRSFFKYFFTVIHSIGDKKVALKNEKAAILVYSL